MDGKVNSANRTSLLIEPAISAQVLLVSGASRRPLIYPPDFRDSLSAELITWLLLRLLSNLCVE